METRGSADGTTCPGRRGPLILALGAAPFQTPPPFIGLILVLSTCMGSAAVPLLNKGGNSAVFGPSATAWRWAEASDTEGLGMIGEGWYGTLLAAQSGR